MQLFIDAHPDEESVRETVLRGLSERPPALPPWLFYDEAGSRLFDDITRLPEYYLTRTEIGILERNVDAMAGRLGPGATIVEFGSGSSLKTALLLDALERPAAYLPVDISRAGLLAAAGSLAERYPAMDVLPVCADYNHPIPRLAAHLSGRHATVFFPGSTIGNFTHGQAARFLSVTRSLVGSGGGLIIGFDLRKPAEMILPAYDDAQGITAAFNRNLLRRVNTALGPVFDPDAWAHRATWNDGAGRVEMRLEATRAMEVRVDDRSFRFGAGDSILTEYSHKYRPEEIRTLLGKAGFRPAAWWTDEAEHFAVIHAT